MRPVTLMLPSAVSKFNPRTPPTPRAISFMSMVWALDELFVIFAHCPAVRVPNMSTPSPAVSSRLNEPAPVKNVMLLTLKPPEEPLMSLTGLSRVVPANSSTASPVSTTCEPPQFASVDQLSSVPAPFHVKVAAQPGPTAATRTTNAKTRDAANADARIIIARHLPDNRDHDRHVCGRIATPDQRGAPGLTRKGRPYCWRIIRPSALVNKPDVATVLPGGSGGDDRTHAASGTYRIPSAESTGSNVKRNFPPNQARSSAVICSTTLVSAETPSARENVCPKSASSR